MKYYLVVADYNNNKSCYLENANSLKVMRKYYNGELKNDNNLIEVSFNQDNRNKYLPLKNVLYFWGLPDSFVVDKDTMNSLSAKYNDYLSFKEVIVIDDEKNNEDSYYVIFFEKIIDGLDKEKSVIKFLADDKFSLKENVKLVSVFKFTHYSELTFVDETFKNFVEENNIEGWIFREAFEK